ncbi:S41 family peptidase [Vallitalea sp.]|jgi:hypothetical protein|uniref:S41 family peptidase n=1 Tax=Vallitalea sp. TaxID=1882829 RepID=UPI0025E0410B|nr:S41 family peptidase [Vallitalea sp.]MCT4687834.1 S41 family peptidase [Vallitalea sp.]
MKKRFCCLLISALIFITSITVFANNDSSKENERLGNTRLNSMSNSSIAIEGNDIYFCLEGENHRHTLYKKSIDENKVKKLLDINISGINVIDDNIYGFIKYEEKNDKKSGLYKVNGKDNKLTLIFEADNITNILIYNEYIYFLCYGSIFQFKLEDLSQVEEYQLIDDEYTTFTVYKDKIYVHKDSYILKGNNLINNIFVIEGGKLKELNSKIDISSNSNVFTIIDNYIYALTRYKDIYGIYRFSINDSEDITCIASIKSIKNFKIIGNYIFYNDSFNNIYKQNLTTKKVINIGQFINLEDFTPYDENTLYYRTLWNQLFKLDIKNTKNTKIYPLKENNKIQDIILKTSQNMINQKNIITNINNVDKYYDYDVFSNKKVRINKEIYKADLKVDNEKKIISFNKYKYNKDKKISKAERWYDDLYIYYSKNGGQYRNLDYFAFINDYFSIFNWFSPNIYTSNDLQLKETANDYIIESNSCNHIMEKLKKDSFMNYYFDNFDNNLSNIKIYIDKEKYSINKVDVSCIIKKNNKIVKEFSVELINQYNCHNMNLAIPKYVYDDCKKYEIAKDYISQAKDEINKQNYKKAINYCDKAISEHKLFLEAYYKKGVALYNLGKYDEAIGQCKLFLDNIWIEDTSDVNILLAKIYLVKEQYYMAKYYLNMVEHFSSLEQATNFNMIAATINMNVGEYYEADDNIIMYLSTKPNDKKAMLLRLEILCKSEQYKECIDYANRISTKFDSIKNYRNYWFYLGKINENFMNYDDAIIDYLQAIQCKDSITELNISMEDIYVGLISSYCCNCEYNKADDYLKKLRKINSSNYNIELFEKIIKKGLQKENVRVADFITNNYLFMDEKTENIIGNFRNESKIDRTDIEKIIGDLNNIHNDSIIFEDSVPNSKTSECKYLIYYVSDNNIYHYFKMPIFYHHTSSLFSFLKYLDKNNNLEEETLILDLRGNSQDITNQAIKTLDLLVPYGTYSYLINKKGQTEDIYTDLQYFKFKNVVIWVDENTGGASELLILSLKKALENVTIVGRKTMGKGTIQKAYVDRKNNYTIYLDNLYWNINEKNYEGKGIQPDIEVLTNNDNDFLHATI